MFLFPLQLLCRLRRSPLLGLPSLYDFLSLVLHSFNVFLVLLGL